MQKTNEMDECAKKCVACYEACVKTLRHCLEKGGRHVEARHVTLVQDCVEICRTSADLLLRGSPRHVATCRACAEICRDCAEDCRRFNDDKIMKACADVCDICAESCESMASAASR